VGVASENIENEMLMISRVENEMGDSPFPPFTSLHRYGICRTSVNGLVHRLKPIITIGIRLRYDYDEKLTCSFFACVELEAGARDTS